MSHDVKVTGVKITNIEDLRAALAQLNQRPGFARLNLVEKGTYRAYYESQKKQCPYIIDIEGCSYNVGLTQEKDENGNDYYVPIIDTYGDYIKRAICNQKGENKSFYTTPLGPLDLVMQEYSAQAAIRGAQEKGYMVLDRVLDEKGVLTLIVDAEVGY